MYYLKLAYGALILLMLYTAVVLPLYGVGVEPVLAASVGAFCATGLSVGLGTLFLALAAAMTAASLSDPAKVAEGRVQALIALELAKRDAFEKAKRDVSA